MQGLFLFLKLVSVIFEFEIELLDQYILSFKIKT